MRMACTQTQRTLTVSSASVTCGYMLLWLHPVLARLPAQSMLSSLAAHAVSKCCCTGDPSCPLLPLLTTLCAIVNANVCAVACKSVCIYQDCVHCPVAELRLPSGHF